MSMRSDLIQNLIERLGPDGFAKLALDLSSERGNIYRLCSAYDIPLATGRLIILNEQEVLHAALEMKMGQSKQEFPPLKLAI